MHYNNYQNEDIYYIIFKQLAKYMPEIQMSLTTWLYLILNSIKFCGFSIRSIIRDSRPWK